jgi:putative heme transporter
VTPGEKSIVRFEIAPRSILWVLGTAGAVWLFLQLKVIALLLVVALVMAGTLNPVVEWIERRGIKRVYALIVLFMVMLALTLLLVFLTVPPLIEQLAGIVRNAPRYREQLIGLLQQREFAAPLARALQSAGLEQPFARVETYLLGYSPRAIKGLGYAVTTLVLAFYLLADGKRSQGALYSIVPREYHMRLARILHNLETIVGGYMRGQLITCAAIGVFTFVLLVICRVPDALSLALFAALVDVIPFVGAILACVPAVFAALAVGVPTGLVVLGSLFVYQEIENRILVPRIYGHVLRLAPATVVLALLAGGLLLGVIGALLALPIAAGIQMMLLEMRVDMPGDDRVDQVGIAREARTDAKYELMSAGASAGEAGQIARHLAQDIRTADALEAADAAKVGAT